MRLYNTLTRSKVDFVPMDAQNVRMYVCGPTVYDHAHIGNARPMIVFDVLFRLLRHKYGAQHVKFVRNITDVDDKINARAAERGVTIRELTEGTAKVFQADVAALGCLAPTHEPRATDHIAGMIEIILRLIERGHAYAVDGEVLFSVPSMSDYGLLSRRPLDEMIAGARVEVAKNKHNAMDFVLWKPSQESEPGWDSPWGRGRPGWHIECSAMSRAFLGETFDIHGGGIDLVFPHHENEIAQSRCAFGSGVMANVWMHNGFLQVEGQKMSKSTGNFVTISDLLHTDVFGGRKWPGAVLRLAMLKTHYRSPIDFTVKALEEAEATIGEWARRVEGIEAQALIPGEIVAALSDDLNTHQMVTVLHQFAKAANDGSNNDSQKLANTLLALGFGAMPVVTDQGGVVFAVSAIVRAQTEDAIKARLAARAAKNWAESDRIRDSLLAQGIVVKDHKDGTATWELRR